MLACIQASAITFAFIEFTPLTRLLDDPRERDDLIVLRLHRPREEGERAIGHIIAEHSK
jgi:hypothetical protein